MSNLKVMPKTAPKSAKDEIIDRLRGEEADQIVVVYRSNNGPFDVLTNQGDVARVLFFLEQFKQTVMQQYSAMSNLPPTS